MKRAIHVIPDTSQSPWVEAIRQRFDCLYEHIRAHITLVFPFDLPFGDIELVRHCQQVSVGGCPFSVTIHPPVRSEDDHLWLPVGYSEPLADLTQRLHGGPLSSLLATRRSNTHHITIARPPLPRTIHDDICDYQITFPVTLEVTSFTLESILPDQHSLELGSFHLRS